MQRSIWRGAISFGLIYVPVELYGASKDGSLSLHLLDSRDFAPVGYQRINKTTGKEVDWAHIVKGYEYEKGHYVALSDADFKHANVKASETIDIVNFTDAADIPAMYFDTPYYLSPQKGGQKVYSLLREALRSTGKVAVATFVMRGRQHLCALVPVENALMLMTLRFASEVHPPAQIKALAEAAKTAKPVPAELAMAKKLVEQMSGPFRPNAFKDTYRADLLRRVQEKIRNKQTHALDVEAPRSERPKAQVIDLMEALKNSLKKRRGGAGRTASERSVPRKASRTAKRA
jgi:DNA end-binding protein Ku